MRLAILLSFLGFLLPHATSQTVLTKTDNAIEVRIGGNFFTRYNFAGAPKPYLWPVLGPTGKEMTRAFPMEKRAGETSDHPHQRSFWFTHGDVNGVDFWSESPRAGKQIQRELQFRGHDTLRTVNDWVDANGKKICEDTRTLRFFAAGGARVLDFGIAVRASEGPLVFGDTKEGSFGIRVADSMMVDRKSGRIVNSRGQTDAAAWGQRAEWVDYHGAVEGETLGVAILDHPQNFRHPTYWHVRTYGLFAVNPFGIADFVPGSPKGAGHHTVAAGETMVLRYRVIFHKGTAAEARIAEAWKEYAESK